MTNLAEPDLWEVSGIKTLPTGEIVPFQYLAKNVVLATGSYDRPNSLDIPGEGLGMISNKMSLITIFGQKH